MDPVQNQWNYKFGLFYFNHNDPRILVPKRLRFLGYSFNFARVETYLVILIIALILAFI
jgi:uncharacterized membrane protein